MICWSPGGVSTDHRNEGTGSTVVSWPFENGIVPTVALDVDLVAGAAAEGIALRNYDLALMSRIVHDVLARAFRDVHRAATVGGREFNRSPNRVEIDLFR